MQNHAEHLRWSFFSKTVSGIQPLDLAAVSGIQPSWKIDRILNTIQNWKSPILIHQKYIQLFSSLYLSKYLSNMNKKDVRTVTINVALVNLEQVFAHLLVQSQQ